MININRVYQTVQNILNIEQRGQLPASDFNNIASLAQLDLLNKLFYDEPYFTRHPKGGMSSSLVRNIQEMQDVFADEVDITRFSPTRFSLPDNLYRLDAVYYDSKGNSDRTDYIKVEKMNHQDYSYIERSSLTRPSVTFPKYLRFHGGENSTIDVLPRTIELIHIDYIRQPETPVWDGFQVGAGTGSILFNDSDSVHFELHPAMEQELIHRILFYAGLSIKQESISQLINGLSNQDEQIEKS